MPFARPTLTDLRNQAQQDITASPAGLSGFLRNAALPILAWAQAGLAYLHYAYLDWIAKQAVPWTATDEYLYGWAGLIGVTQKDAIAASGTVTISGTSATPPLSVPAGALINRADGVQFTVTTTTALTGGSAAVPVQAVLPGAAGNTDAGTLMSLSNPIVGVTSAGSAGLITGGTDQETQDSLRSRMLQEYAAPPHGGDLADYIEWATAVPGVTRAWANPNGAGAGSVVVYVMLDAANAAHGGFPQGSNGGAATETRITPATGDQLTVANAIFPLQPVTALVTVSAPIASPVNFTVANLGTANTPAMQAAIAAALTDMFLRISNVGGTLDPASMAAWSTIEPNDWYQALNSIPGLSGFDVTAPSGPLTPATGQLYTLGTVTYQS